MGQFEKLGLIQSFCDRAKQKMETPVKVQVLTEVHSHLDIFKIYNGENFVHRDRNQNFKSIFVAFGVTILISSIPIVSALAVLQFFENQDFSIIKIVRSAPTVLSIIYIWIEFIALVWKIRAVMETIERLQNVIDQRKFITGSFAVELDWAIVENSGN